LGSPVKPYSGYTYVYTDVNTAGSWKVGNLNETNAAYYTVSQLGLYGGKATSKVGWGMWNDQTHTDLNGPCVDHEKDGQGNIYAHSKGLIGFDSSTGFWMSHSAPGFPYDHDLCPTSWFFPSSQTVYAQHFFCVSISASDVDRFGSFLQYYHAFIYDSKIPSGMDLSNFQTFTEGHFHKTETSITFSTLGGEKLTAVGKYATTNADLYEDYIAPLLSTGLLVQSWCGGIYEKACIRSYCEGSSIVEPSDPQKDSGKTTYAYDSVDIEELNFGTSLSYPNAYNHAKWAVASDPKGKPQPWVCAADNNRQYTQRKRGGGALCFQNQPVWTALNKAISQINTTCTEF